MTAVIIVAIVGWAVAVWAVGWALIERIYARKVDALHSDALDSWARAVDGWTHTIARCAEIERRAIERRAIETYDIDPRQL